MCSWSSWSTQRLAASPLGWGRGGREANLGSTGQVEEAERTADIQASSQVGDKMHEQLAHIWLRRGGRLSRHASLQLEVHSNAKENELTRSAGSCDRKKCGARRWHSHRV